MSSLSYTMSSTVDEALTLARRHPGDYLYLAGGTDVQIHRKQGLVRRRHLIDLSGIGALHGIVREGEAMRIGTLVTLDEIASSPEMAARLPLLVRAARSVATPVLRKTATLGGNLLVKNRCFYYNQSEAWRKAIGSCLRDDGEFCLVTGSKPNCYARNVSDTAPALIALDAKVTIRNHRTEAVFPLMDLYASSGLHPYRHLEEDALITGVSVPLTPVRSWFRKLRLRRSLDFTSLTLAAAVDEAGQARLCINGVSMAPVLLEGRVSELTLDTLQRQARRACQTVDNDQMPLKYRREMMAVYLEEWWRSVSNKDPD